MYDRGRAVWVAALADGRRVYMDDGRFGREDRAWLRLATSGLRIVALWPMFRRREFRNILPDNQLGYYFSQGVGGDIFQNDRMKFFNFGYLKTGEAVCRIQVWKVPELTLFHERTRPMEESLRDGMLILNG